MDQIIIVGAGEHGTVVADVVRAERRYELLGFVDDRPDLIGQMIVGLTVLGPVAALVERYSGVAAIIAIGSNGLRHRIAEKLEAAGVRFATAIHPNATVSPYASAAAGTVVMPRVVINARAEIGEHVILNTGCIVEHDCIIGRASHISVGAILAGRVTVGQETLVGVGAIVLPHLAIGRRTTIGAGAVVTRPVADDVVAVGVPAHVING